MSLRPLLLIAVLSFFFTAEANAQLFRRFARANDQPRPQQNQGYGYQGYGYQGRLTAKPGYRSNANAYRYDAYGRPYPMNQNGYYRPANQAPCACQRSQQTQTSQQKSVQQTRGQVDLARHAQLKSRVTAREQLALSKPRISKARSAKTLVDNSGKLTPGNQVSQIPTSNKITNPVPAGLSLSSPVETESDVVQATAIMPVETSTEAFSVLEKIND